MSTYPMQKIYEEAGFGAEGSRRLAGLFEVIQNIRARRQRSKEAELLQPRIHGVESGYSRLDILGMVAFFVVYILANSIAPVVWTPCGTVDPAFLPFY